MAAALAATPKGDRMAGTVKNKTANQALRVDVALSDKAGEELWLDHKQIQLWSGAAAYSGKAQLQRRTSKHYDLLMTRNEHFDQIDVNASALDPLQDLVSIFSF